MTFDELISACNLSHIEVTLIVPVRNGDMFKKGRLMGIKSGVYGAPWGKKGYGPAVWKKRPKVQIAYNAYQMFKKEYSDWVDVDNCTFEILQEPETKSTPWTM